MYTSISKIYAHKVSEVHWKSVPAKEKLHYSHRDSATQYWDVMYLRIIYLQTLRFLRKQRENISAKTSPGTPISLK